METGEVSCVSFLKTAETLPRVSDVEIQQNPVMIKTPPNKHENPFTKKDDCLWLGCELGCDEYWEAGQFQKKNFCSFFSLVGAPGSVQGVEGVVCLFWKINKYPRQTRGYSGTGWNLDE